AYLDYIEKISIEIADFNPIGPTAHISLSETLPKCNNRIINIQNNNDGVLDSFVEELNIDDIPISVPVLTPVYKKFEANNPEIRLCIYKWYNQNKCFDFSLCFRKKGKEYKQVILL
ncbi:13856_t:CDS:2, partial [Gigaspora margarita]